MDRTLPLFVIGLIFGGGLGFAIAAASGVTFDGHDHANPAHHAAGSMDHTGMDHAMMHDTPVDVPAADAPQVSLMLHPDPMAGYNLQVQVQNFDFSPQNASRSNVTGQGHAHVYINGQKLGRIYGEWTHLDALPEGVVEVSVTLNTNDHRPLAIAGTPIAASQVIQVENP